MKKILFDIGHPAQVHCFKNIYWSLTQKGWSGKFILKNKEIASYLLDKYQLPYIKLAGNKKSKLLNILSTIWNLYTFFLICIKEKPAIVISRGSIHSLIICKILNLPNLMMADTEHSLNITSLASIVLTNKSFRKKLGEKQIRFDANMELLYLHPQVFKIPKKIPEELSFLKSDKKNIIMRFVSWAAHHDVGLKGFTDKEKIKIVNELAKYGNVFISSEATLPNELLKYKIQIPPEYMHLAIFESSLVFGESSTMASEAGVLGTPAIYIDGVGRGYTDEEENYGLVYNFKPTVVEKEKALLKAINLLKSDLTQIEKNRSLFLNEKINPTAFMVWFIENYPTSARIMKENPDYQYNFK